jgi:hypothetical protein
MTVPVMFYWSCVDRFDDEDWDDLFAEERVGTHKVYHACNMVEGRITNLWVSNVWNDDDRVLRPIHSREEFEATLEAATAAAKNVKKVICIFADSVRELLASIPEYLVLFLVRVPAFASLKLCASRLLRRKGGTEPALFVRVGNRISSTPSRNLPRLGGYDKIDCRQKTKWSFFLSTTKSGTRLWVVYHRPSPSHISDQQHHLWVRARGLLEFLRRRCFGHRRPRQFKKIR